MNIFRITSWTVTADKPDTTEVVVTVLEDISGVMKRTSYELEVSGKFDTITPEFEAAVEQKLKDAGLI